MRLSSSPVLDSIRTFFSWVVSVFTYSESSFEPFARLTDGSGGRLSSIHAPAPKVDVNGTSNSSLNLASLDEQERRTAIEQTNRSIDHAAATDDRIRNAQTCNAPVRRFLPRVRVEQRVKVVIRTGEPGAPYILKSCLRPKLILWSTINIVSACGLSDLANGTVIFDSALNRILSRFLRESG